MNKIIKFSTIFTKAYKREGKNYSYFVLVFRLLYWRIKYKGGFANFFMLNLNKKDNSFFQLIGAEEFIRIHNQLNPAYYRSILEDKYVFDRFLKGFNYPLAEMHAIILNNSVFWLKENRREPLDNILDYELDCYCKMGTKWGGQDVYKIAIHNRSLFINNQKSDITSLKKIISGAMFVLQKTIVQHAEMNRLNSSCVNTIRIITIHDGEKAFNFLNFLRIGVGNSVVDNISHGGLGIGVYDDGTLFETANDKFGYSTWITHHPDTNTEFKSFKIPYYKESLELAKKMHQSFHCFFIIGWDFAITEAGPVIIEGNPVTELVYEQSLYGGLRQEFLEFAKSYREKMGI
jgi:hypothetical protein